MPVGHRAGQFWARAFQMGFTYAPHVSSMKNVYFSSPNPKLFIYQFSFRSMSHIMVGCTSIFLTPDYWDTILYSLVSRVTVCVDCWRIKTYDEENICLIPESTLAFPLNVETLSNPLLSLAWFVGLSELLFFANIPQITRWLFFLFLHSTFDYWRGII